MKKLMMIAFAFMALTATAQRGGGKGEVKNLNAKERATLQTKKMTLALVLNESQIKKVHKINLKQAEERLAMREARTRKKEDSKSEKNHFAQRQKMLDNRIAVQNKMQEILDDEQFKLWRNMPHSRKKAKGRKRGKQKGNGKKAKR